MCFPPVPPAAPSNCRENRRATRDSNSGCHGLRPGRTPMKCRDASNGDPAVPIALAHREKERIPRPTARPSPAVLLLSLLRSTPPATNSGAASPPREYRGRRASSIRFLLWSAWNPLLPVAQAEYRLALYFHLCERAD